MSIIPGEGGVMGVKNKDKGEERVNHKDTSITIITSHLCQPLVCVLPVAWHFTIQLTQSYPIADPPTGSEQITHIANTLH